VEEGRKMRIRRRKNEEENLRKKESENLKEQE
jgi:hypothetical protein